ncbi:hypothetical protein [uncultured Muriicola sp.]|uniref:hypothetical protein n=1 Tax=uncultured Muriicola sp. TaxID=1583102 RepID=UPI002622A7AB|nr:hypothetical protein [uncultured Muriicola sp.]
MKFNWIISRDIDDDFRRYCIDLEYKLRPKITKFLMSRLDEEFGGDYSCFHFDVDMVTENISISNKTPVEYISLFSSDFEREINGTCCT